MAIVIKPLREQSKFPVENKPSLDPKEKEIYNDVFALQNAFKILFIVLDNTFANIEANINTGLSGSGIPEAPMDGKLYGRRNGAWEEIV